MNCEQVQEQISQFIDGELPPPEESSLFVHLGVCEQCRTFLKDAFSLKNAIACAKQVVVPVSLDRRVLSKQPTTMEILSSQNLYSRFKATKYSFRTFGLAIIISALTGVICSSFWHTSNQPQQTIVCLTPLPEVEVNGYIVVAPSPMKGLQQ